MVRQNSHLNSSFAARKNWAALPLRKSAWTYSKIHLIVVRDVDLLLGDGVLFFVRYRSVEKTRIQRKKSASLEMLGHYNDIDHIMDNEMAGLSRIASRSSLENRAKQGRKSLKKISEEWSSSMRKKVLEMCVSNFGLQNSGFSGSPETLRPPQKIVISDC